METTTAKSAEATQVACEMCLKQVPSSEAVMAEAVDYVAYFCGLECYERWKHRGESAPAEPAEVHS